MPIAPPGGLATNAEGRSLAGVARATETGIRDNPVARLLLPRRCFKRHRGSGTRSPSHSKGEISRMAADLPIAGGLAVRRIERGRVFDAVAPGIAERLADDGRTT